MTKIRNILIEAMRREVIGPDPKAPYIHNETGEELLLEWVHGNPLKRYGTSILFPQRSNSFFDYCDDEDKGGNEFGLGEEDQEVNVDASDIRTGIGDNSDQSDLNSDDSITLANNFKPSSLGFTFRIKNDFSGLQMIFSGGRYIKSDNEFNQFKVDKKGTIEINQSKTPSPYWIRLAINFNKPISASDIPIKKKEFKEFPVNINDDEEWIKLRLTNRTTKSDIEEGLITLTITAINCKLQTSNYPKNEDCVFQSSLKIISDSLHPFDEKVRNDKEIAMLNLLYRNKRSYAFGHGIGVEWEQSSAPAWISTNALPSYEIPLVEPTDDLELKMYEMSDLGDWDSAVQTLDELVIQYQSWIEKQELAVELLELRYQEPAKENIKNCKESLNRISSGINLLKDSSNTKIISAFKFMNRAMLWQQQRSKIKQRRWIKKGNRISEIEPFEIVSLKEFQNIKGKGRWRPFQLAFILLNLESIVNPSSKERGIVELIWFPTGGGKTEAYLGVAAFTIFWKRLINPDNQDIGTTILMRYTLRLLTTQQFERACSMTLACDLIVRADRNIDLFGFDTKPVSIGLWVGGKNTPNTTTGSKGAVTQYNRLQIDNNQRYNFIVLKCPCCGAQIGKLDKNQRTRTIKTKGLYKEDRGSVYFKCENSNCETRDILLPVYVTDDVIYERTPDLVIATVDKFAMIPFKKETGRLFGFRERADGSIFRVHPPELIIQDELHLISGPLGTMVGLYETMVQTLCNDYKKDCDKFIPKELNDFIPPKIIASTATISRAKEQVKSLYAIERLHIFPSQGLEFGNTWFSREVDPSEKPGRKYVGICPSGYPSAQTTIVRTYSSVLQSVYNLINSISLQDLDYYWTLVGYFNSIRELGGAINLVYADVVERIKQINIRDLNQQRRYNLYPIELTSRVDSSDIPEYLKKLEITKIDEKESRENDQVENKYAKDLCLATNMIATGVDIGRFGLMFIHGQPKTTAEYIQASSRVGREIDGPGLVFILFSPNKARDKSQYEQFQTYHSRIYANVEPTSVTPFSIVARERALHAVFTGLMRHLNNSNLRNNPIIANTDFDELSHFIKKLILNRVSIINQDEYLNISKEIDDFINKWRTRNYSEYGDAGNIRINSGVIPLLYSLTGQVKDPVAKSKSNGTPSSMRGVDTESRIKII